MKLIKGPLNYMNFKGVVQRLIFTAIYLLYRSSVTLMIMAAGITLAIINRKVIHFMHFNSESNFLVNYPV